MNSEFELIRYNDNLPARIDIKQGVISTTYHWHKEIELVYVMDGAVEINVNNTAQTLHTDEFRLINSVENHSLSADNAKCLILDISYEFADRQRQRGGGGDPQSSLAAFADAERAEASGLAAVCAYHGAPSCAVCPVQAPKPQRCDQ